MNAPMGAVARSHARVVAWILHYSIWHGAVSLFHMPQIVYTLCLDVDRTHQEWESRPATMPAIIAEWYQRWAAFVPGQTTGDAAAALQAASALLLKTGINLQELTSLLPYPAFPEGTSITIESDSATEYLMTCFEWFHPSREQQSNFGLQQNRYLVHISDEDLNKMRPTAPGGQTIEGGAHDSTVVHWVLVLLQSNPVVETC